MYGKDDPEYVENVRPEKLRSTLATMPEDFIACG
jgi:hypothetical protein